MSKIKNNPILKTASGMLGKTIVYRSLGGKMIMANTPTPSEKELKPGVVEARAKFKRAIHYAKYQMQDPEMKALYQTGVNASKRSAYTVAVSDYATPPTVHDIEPDGYTGAVGQSIRIRASDDFIVKGVRVTILDATGAVIETGDAVLPPKAADFWQYVTTVANPTLPGTKIKAVAIDYADNTGEFVRTI